MLRVEFARMNYTDVPCTICRKTLGEWAICIGAGGEDYPSGWAYFHPECVDWVRRQLYASVESLRAMQESLLVRDI